MAVAMRSNGLHHAVSLGTFEVGTKSSSTRHHLERSYDSDDENMSRRRLRHTSSTELYPRASVYSKGDIREQYCLTDRQVHSIERSRRDRFFGCLSRRGAPQSFLGVCVGRRAPSDENLAAYAPFYRYPRYAHQYAMDEKLADADADSSYFRRRPASILSSSKMTDAAASSAAVTGGGGGGVGTGVGNRYSWVGGLPTSSITTCNPTDNVNYANEPRTTWLAPTIDTYYQDIFMTNCLEQNSNVNCCSYHCPTTALVGLTAAPQTQLGPTAPRTKHVSFARSHTLTSFDDVNMGLRSSARLKGARSQERLIGGKKAVVAASTAPPTYMPTAAMTMLPAQTVIQQPYSHMHGHPHHHAPIHLHPCVPTYSANIQLGQPVAGVNIMPCPLQTMQQQPASPEVVVVEKKFRNAMKTQATQTEMRKSGLSQVLALSPRTIHKVKVVSQSAQTNGLQNGKKLTKSLSEMPNGSSDMRGMNDHSIQDFHEHEFIHRTQSDEPPSSPLNIFESFLENQNNISYYQQPPPPLDTDDHEAYSSSRRASYVRDEDNRQHIVDVHTQAILDFESNSLPRRTCTFHRMESAEYNSNSLPRTEPFQSHELCKHITDCTELMVGTDTSLLDFSRPHLLPPPSQYCKSDEDDIKQLKQASSNNRRMSMIPLTKEEPDVPFRRDDIRRQSMPVFVKTEKLIDGQGVRSSLRSKHKNKMLAAETTDEKEIFIDFKPNLLLEPLHKSKKSYRTAAKLGLGPFLQHTIII